jgi:hypothetical protein
MVDLEQGLTTELLKFQYGDLTTEKALWLAREQAKYVIAYLEREGVVRKAISYHPGNHYWSDMVEPLRQISQRKSS